MKYNHTQIGYLPLVSFTLLILYFVFLSFYSGEYIILLVGSIIIFIVVLLFMNLNISISDNKLKLKYGIGLFRKSFLLSEIKSIKVVKNKWYYGWGIRIWFWPKMIIYNISGYDAVEIVMTNNKIYRIGTNDVINLKEIISSNMN